MVTIVSPFEIAQKLYPTQYNTGMACKYSSFMISLPCEEGTLLYHTLTGEMVLLDRTETVNESNQQLFFHKFIVPTKLDEHKLALQIRSIASMMKGKKRQSSFLIPTTTDCNARCFYCFEHGCKRITMTAETAKAVAAYMIRVSGNEELKITWFGGEPLYNQEAIETICSELKKADKPFSSVMVTNGYYLDRETAETAYRDWNLRLVQITLDGTKDVYLRTKAYIDHDPDAFDRVINNIITASKTGIAVNTRLNMDANNAEDLFCLAAELKDRLNGCKNITGWCELLRDYIVKVGNFPSEEVAVETCLRLQKTLDEQWPRSKEGLPRNVVINSCIADNDACETILPDGTISKCDKIDFQSIISSIWSESVDYSEIQAWKETIVFPECKTCSVFPQCIVLKRCKGVKNGCTKALRIRKRLEIEEKMMLEYELYKKG